MVINHFIISAYFTFFTTLFLAFFVLSRNSSRKLYQLFFLYTLSIAVWSFAVSRFVPDLDPAAALYWGKMLHVGAIFIPVFFLHFVFVFLDIEKSERPKLLTVYFLAAVFQVLNWFNPWLISGTSYRDLYCYPTPGTTYLFFFIFFVACVVFGLLKLVQAYLTAKGNVRNQLIYLILGSIIGYTGGLDNFAITIDWRIFPLFPYGAYGIALYVFIMAYAILRHRLLDIELVIKRTFVYSALILTISATYAGLVIYASQLLQNILGNISPFLMAVIASIIIIFGLRPLERWFTTLTDRWFFKKPYNLADLRRRYSHGLAKLVTLDKLVRKMTIGIFGPMRLSSACGLIYNHGNKSFEVKAVFGKAKGLQGAAFPEDQALFKKLKSGEILVYEEIKRWLESQPYSYEGSQIAEMMNKLNASAIVPAVSKGKNREVLGILALGEKMSGDVFTTEDLRFFSDLSGQATIAIENSLLQEKNIEMDRDAALGRMAHGIVHDLKNPLTSIQTAGQILGYEIAEVEKGNKTTIEIEKLKKIGQMVPEMTQKMARLTNSLLKFIKPAAERLEEADISTIIEDAIAFCSMQFQRKDIKYVTQFADLPKIYLDVDGIWRVFMNLINNAVRFMPQGGAITITTALDDRKSNIKISVSDTGQGIAPEILPHIFDRGYTTGGGTGEGLAFVREMIESYHKGKISADSETGRGTTFTILLPLTTKL